MNVTHKNDSAADQADWIAAVGFAADFKLALREILKLVREKRALSAKVSSLTDEIERLKQRESRA